MEYNQLIEKYLKPMNPIPTDHHFLGSLPHQTKCVLFDIYGTLLISSSGDIGGDTIPEDNYQALQTLLNTNNCHIPPEKLLYQLKQSIETSHEHSRNKGIDYPEVDMTSIWQRLLPHLSKKQIMQFAFEFEWIMNPVFPMPNLLETLSFIKKFSIDMGIISNAQFYTPIIMSYFLKNALSSFGFISDLTFFSYELGWGKPSMKLFEAATDQLKSKHIMPHSVLYVGNDMLKDIYPAQKAGFMTALFAGDKRSLRLRTENELCQSIKPDGIITDLIQIKLLIES